ncbi:MAG: transporter substrate-binding domain-containing protein [Alteromonadaceae bacterium]|nr:transporter substrate-binding domain-containing protein [Alteromonadaceae bacterium]
MYGVNSNAIATQITLVTEYLPPYQIVGEDNHNVTGFATDVVLETFKRSNIEYSIASYPWVRSYNLTLKNPNTCLFSIVRIPIRENKFAWVGQITKENNAVIWGLKSNNHTQHIKQLSDIKNYITAVNKDGVAHLGMIENGFVAGKHLYVLGYTKSLINLLVTRPEIDFIVADDISISYRAKLAGININLLQRVLEIKSIPLNFYLACNKQSNKTMLHTLQDKLSEIHRDGTYIKILARWKNKMPHLQ